MRAQFETNVFGAVWITQAALPLLRAQGSGHILQVSSIGGLVAFAKVGLYNSTKFALEGLSDALAQEVASFGVKVTLVEPGSFSTDWAGSSAVHTDPLPDYERVERGRPSPNRGDPAATAAAILTLVDAENPPLRLILGEPPLALSRAAYEQRLASWDEWADVSRAAQGNQGN